MQLRFPDSPTVPLFHDSKALSDPSFEQVNVIALETTFIPAGYEAGILGELLNQSFWEKLQGIFEPSPACCEKYQLMAFSCLRESGEMIPTCLINFVEDVTVYRGTSFGNFSVVGCAEVAATD